MIRILKGLRLIWKTYPIVRKSSSRTYYEGEKWHPNRLVTSKLPFLIEPEHFELSVIANGRNLGDPARVQWPKPDPQRLQFLKPARPPLEDYVGATLFLHSGLK
jgi:hypothetical protein